MSQRSTVRYEQLNQEEVEVRESSWSPEGCNCCGRASRQKGCTRKRLLPVFLILFMGVVGATVGLGIWATQRKHSAAQESDNPTDAQDDSADSAAGGVDLAAAYKMGTYRYASVAADDERCSEIGTRIMARYCGSAVDAAIATMLCVGVVNAHSTGIGGGSFMTVYERATQTSFTFDFREEAPGGASENMFKGNGTLSSFGGLAIGVPGEIHGYWTAHQKFGRVDWKILFEPTIKMCEEGFEIGKALGNAIAGKEEVILADPELSEFLVDKHTGKLLKKGQTMFRPKLAKTLRTIANEGAHAFYNGSLAQDVADDIQERGGIITKEDLGNYRTNGKEPISFDIGGLKFYSVRPPSSGVVLGFILNILDGYDLSAESLQKDPVLTYHRIVEAFKFAYAKRTDLGDEDYIDIAHLLANLTSEDFAEQIRGQIWDNQTHTFEYYGPTFFDQSKTGTSHASILAANGDAVSITSTINTHFGSKVRGRRTGIIFNNEMDDFSSPNVTNFFGIPPSPANFIKPGKRPLSSMCPAIFVDEHGDVKLVVGASGGTKITTSTALVAMRTLWFGEKIKAAIDGRRIHHQLLPPYMQYEPDFPMNVVEGLLEKLHNVSASYGLGASVVQGIQVQDNIVYSYSDFRKGGRPDGY